MSLKPPFRGPGCPAPALLEAFSAGDQQALGSHIAGCTDCRAYVDGLISAAAEFKRARPTERFLGQIERLEAAKQRQPKRWWWPVVAGGLVAFGLALAVLRVMAPPDETRFKGAGSGLQVFLRQAGGSVVVTEDQKLHEGDELRFGFRATAAGHLVVLQLDGADQVALRSGGQLTVNPGEIVVPGAIALDGSPGPEWFISVFSPQLLDVASLQQQLRGQSKRDHLSLECGACQVDTVRAQK